MAWLGFSYDKACYVALRNVSYSFFAWIPHCSVRPIGILPLFHRLIYCRDGVSHSPAVVLTYLMAWLGFSYDKAYRFMKVQRPGSASDRGFRMQLKSFQESYLLPNLWHSLRSSHEWKKQLTFDYEVKVWFDIIWLISISDMKHTIESELCRRSTHIICVVRLQEKVFQENYLLKHLQKGGKSSWRMTTRPRYCKICFWNIWFDNLVPSRKWRMEFRWSMCRVWRRPSNTPERLTGEIVVSIRSFFRRAIICGVCDYGWELRTGGK